MSDYTCAGNLCVPRTQVAAPEEIYAFPYKLEDSDEVRVCVETNIRKFLKQDKPVTVAVYRLVEMREIEIPIKQTPLVTEVK